MLQAIVFDFDGVLVDSEPLHYQAFLDVARPMGVTFDYDHYRHELIGYDDRDVFRILLAHGDMSVPPSDEEPTLRRLIGEKQQAFEALVRAGGVEAVPGALELLREAAGEMPVAIASGATRADIELITQSLGVRDLFDAVVTADDVQRSKPDPATYALAVRRLSERGAAGAERLEAATCLAIEDTAAGIESARGAGLMTLGVTTTGPAGVLQHARRVHEGEGLAGVTLAKLREWYA